MPRNEHTELLLNKAAQDEYLLDKMLDDPQAPTEAFGFHAQQAAEKLLKAVLVFKAIRYPRTHRIAELLDLFQDNSVQVPAEFETLRFLTPYAVEFRYDPLPAELDEPLDKQKVRLEIHSLRKWVHSLVSPTSKSEITLNPLKVALSDLITAMTMSSEGISISCLDLRTGEIHVIPEELVRAIEDGDDAVEDLPEWEKQILPVAREYVEENENLKAIEQIESHDAFETMRDFIRQVKDQKVQQRLQATLERPKPFRGFKDALHEFPGLPEEWYLFEQKQQEQSALDWLKSIGIEPIPPT